MSATTCPVFHPDVDELWNLSEFIQNIECNHPDIGICKIIPPRAWYERKYDIHDLKIPQITPIKQVVTGGGGVFHVTAFERKAMSISSFSTNANKNADFHINFTDKEREFWRTMGRVQRPLYGADMEGTLFDSQVSASILGFKEWNFDSGLKDLLRLLPYKVPGVNTSMLYVGEWRAMFPFHVEDLDLYSINYLHTGAPKSWYSIAPSRRSRFEGLAEAFHAIDKRECPEYLRHKTKMFSPTKLRDSGLKFDTVVQHKGEFVVTFPGAYHGGFNHSFNIAEATNFATPRWLEIGRRATRCICRPHSVYINMDELSTIYRRKCLTERAKKFTQQSSSARPIPSFTGSRDSRVIDLTGGKGTHDAMSFFEDADTLRCECGQVRTVASSDRKLTQCAECHFYVHSACANGASDRRGGFVCYMCHRIDQYAEDAPITDGACNASVVANMPDEKVDKKLDSSSKALAPVVVHARRCPNPSLSRTSSPATQYADAAHHEKRLRTEKHSFSHRGKKQKCADGSDGSSTSAAVMIDPHYFHKHEHRRKASRAGQSHHKRLASVPVPDFWELQLRDRVVVAAEGRLQGTVGTITGIEGDQCRLHIKGLRKSADQWIPLQDCRLSFD